MFGKKKQKDLVNPGEIWQFDNQKAGPNLNSPHRVVVNWFADNVVNYRWLANNYDEELPYDHFVFCYVKVKDSK